MVSSIASSTVHHLISPVVSILGLGSNFKIRPRVSFLSVKKDCVLGYKELKETITRSGVSFEGYFNSEAELVLEREILVFMKNSRNPNEFPTKKELLDAGRLDLVNAITKTGGWLALGWDSSDDENDLESNDFNDLRELHTRVESYQQRHEAASPSGRPLEMEADDEDKGVEGILSRLKKHRRLSFDLCMEKNIYASSKDNGCLSDFHMSTDVGKSTAQGTWTIPRRHFSDFQAAEIDYGKEDSTAKMLAIQRDSQLQERHQEINPDQIRSRLQDMQLELSSALRSLRSKSQTLNSEVLESSSSELQQLSDAWEFQENEHMKAEDKLRSIRAKLAVFEGKIALSVIDTQKLVVEKQRRIDSARRTLQLLRTTSIFWTHSALEVILVGSFDGWTSQIKMEKTKTGIFSASLKLYPGRYEIKFIVDGIWRVDPLLPIIHNNGYENNSLIVHERSA
ncbi:protein PTST homolog 2, chloroplastic-like [Cynara cardunculus var. scolymus]|uniref:protein PTST homolog 2, chloroplastic-like n=1 Tax=Cynara cardunculus var. scolymus TaxID=59895 RepID=UPI000D62E883|nr:protein PTST homolog 2, chloroplastic-like [Cynara cardunculus var. scolymus]